MPLKFETIAKQNRRAKVLLIGEAGVGKTHAALTFPNPAVIDAEGSIDWFSDRFAFTAVPTKSYSDVRDLTKQVREGKVQCETLVIDSLTSIYNGLVNAATMERQKQGSDDLRPLDWGRIKRKFSSLLDELYHKLKVNVVCVGWIKAEYAKPGDTVQGKVVAQNDLVKIGEVFDGDKKTMYAFDFVIKVLGNDGKRARAQIVKSRSGALKAGQIIDDFSWKTLEGLLPKGASTYEGMTDEGQEAKDQSLFVGGPAAQPAANGGPRDTDTPENRDSGRKAVMAYATSQSIPDAHRHEIAQAFFGETSSTKLSHADLRKLYRLLTVWVRDRDKDAPFELWLETQLALEKEAANA